MGRIADSYGLDVAALRRDLADWFGREGRSLPWRERGGVYGVWVSEIMLQQTTVAAVAPRWREFLARFPDVQTLAGADEAEVLEAWRGLGYYRRARQLHRAARIVVDELGGVFPRDVAGWRSLPGVGPYTAGAVVCIGLGRPAPAVDTNVDRVLRRLVCDDATASADLRPSTLRDLAAELVDPAAPAAWTQALMDLGAGPCAPARPDCASCPLRGACRAGNAGTTDAVPGRKARPTVVPVVLSQIVARDEGGVLVLPAGAAPVLEAPGENARTSYGGLYRGYRRLPATTWVGAETAPAAEELRRRLREEWARWLGLSTGEVRFVGSRRGTVTRYRQEILVFAAAIRGGRLGDGACERLLDGDGGRPLAAPDRLAAGMAATELPGLGLDLTF